MKVVMKASSRFITLVAILVAAATVAQAQIVVKTDSAKKAEPPLTKKELREKREREKNGKRPPPAGNSFSIEVVPGANNLYSILLTDENNRAVPGNFIRPQIDIFRALLEAASQFALTAEEAGAPGAPKTTRFMDRHEQAFIIDVEKTADESHFFLTIQSVLGTLTVNAGTIRRGAKTATEEPLLYKILTKVQDAISNQTQTQ